jgi:putative DNA primase/helicase
MTWRPILPVPEGVQLTVPRHRLGTPSRTWEYRDVSGRLSFCVCRFDQVTDGKPAKDVLPLCYCEGPAGAQQWRWRAPDEPRPLYGLDQLAARPDAPVLICEGEKTADAAAVLCPDWVAITSPGGAMAAGKADWRPLSGRRVTVWPDHDAAGARYADEVASVVAAVGGAAAVVKVPDQFPPAWDLADVLPEGVDTGRLHFLLESTEPPAVPDAKAEIARLARLSTIGYDRERQTAADRLGCRVATLDTEVKAAKGAEASAVGQGRTLELSEPDKWPDSVDGAELLDDVERAIRRHVVIDDAPRDAVALWCAAVHAFASFDIFPRLFLTAPTKSAGKSTLLDTIERLVPRPLTVASASAAALFRTIPVFRPVLLLDEADAWARDNEDVRAVINAGHKRGAAVLRCVGDDNEPRAFDVFAPAALAAIGRLPDTIEDRSIIVQLRRKMPDQTVEPLRAGSLVLGRLARQLARWASDHATDLSNASPTMPTAIANRTADNWAPIFAVADLAGGDWPHRARRAAAVLTRGEDTLRGVMLLADIRAVFGADNHISSDELATLLGELEARPWADYRNGRPITKAQLSRMLSTFGIHSKSIRRGGGQTPKGFSRESFADAWARYLPHDPPLQSATTPQPLLDKAFGDLSKRHNGPAGATCGVLENGDNPFCGNDCDVVALSIPGLGETDAWLLFEERAAIREYDGGLPRIEAERRAGLDLAGFNAENPHYPACPR